MNTVIPPVMGMLVPSHRLNVRALHQKQDLYLRTYRKDHGTVIAFSAESIDWGKGRVNGYRFIPTGRGRNRWKKGSYPIPQAVFRDLAGESETTRRLYEWTRGRVFNVVGTSSKHFMNRVLSASPELRDHIPETRFLSPSSLHALLARYGVVYVKPDMGGEGRGIFRVSRGRDSYVISHAGKRWSASAGELYVSLRRRMRREPYIVQQGVDLALHRGRPFDVRLMVQRGANGDWMYTGAVAKVAGRRAVVTNFVRGRGRVLPVGYVLRSAGWERSQMITRMSALATAAADALDGQTGLYGELGFDVAVDRSGRIWIIEANPRPSHWLLDMIADKAMYRRANAAVYSYLRYLAIRGPEAAIKGVSESAS